MDLRRKAYDKLLEWKTKSDGSSALLVEGARRVGKSYLVENFARNEYDSYILINFSNPRNDVIDTFEKDFDDLDLFFNKLSAIYNVVLHRRRSVIVFDEVQRYPHARELIKFLVEDGRYDYIETGSLISIKANVKDIVIPSEEDSMTLNPLDFEEFLWAMGDQTLYPYIRDCFDRRVPLGEGLHHKAMNLYRQYILVGGMPMPVIKYIKTKDFGQVDEQKRRILKLYRNDIVKYAKGYHAKVLGLFEEIPAQLSKKEKKFNLADIEVGAKYRSYDSAFMWLADGMIINQCFNSNDPGVGLSLNLDSTKQKCYMADTGLLVTHAFADRSRTENDLYRAILLDRLHVNEGMIAENAVAQALVSSDHRLFFYSRTDKENSENTMEIDFLIIRDGKVSSLEVKSSGHLSHSSLDKFRKKFGSKTGEQFMLYPGDLKEKDRITCLPLYMAWLL